MWERSARPEEEYSIDSRREVGFKTRNARSKPAMIRQRNLNLILILALISSNAFFEHRKAANALQLPTCYFHCSKIFKTNQFYLAFQNSLHMIFYLLNNTNSNCDLF